MKSSNYFQFLFFLILAFMISACSTETNDIPVVDLEHVSSSTDLALSDLLYDIELIKLELVADQPVPGFFFPWVGEKHILIISRQFVLQYTRDGSYIRTLLKQGNGPGEFRYIYCYDVDEENDILYYADSGVSGKIFMVDLETGRQLNEIILPSKSRFCFNGIILTEPNRLLCILDRYSEDKYLYLYVSADGKVEYGAPRVPFSGEVPAVQSSGYIGRSGGRISYMPEPDTVFTLYGQLKTPYLIIKAGEIFNMSANVLHGNMPVLALETSEHTLITNPEIQAKTFEGGGFSANTVSNNLFLMYNHNFSVKKINNFFIDYLGYTEEMPRFSNTGKYATLTIEALSLIEKTNRALNNNIDDPGLIERLSDLKNKVNEGDNPYLLIGRLK